MTAPSDGPRRPSALRARVAGLSLVLPAHNEGDNLRWLLPRVQEVLSDLAEEFEVIVVDDGSTDGTGDVARQVSGELGLRCTVLRHERKSGYGVTVGDGLGAATLPCVAFIDADGQLDPADLARLLPLLADHALVAGWRTTREDPAFRSVVSAVFNRLVLLAFRLPVRDVNCAIKVIRRDALQGLLPLRAHSALINAELYWGVRAAGGSFAQVPVPHHPRRMGRRSGGRLVPILRASKELVTLRLRLARRRR